jgi:hypothetical protein
MVSVVNNYFNSELADVCVSIYNPGYVGGAIGSTIFECNQSRVGPANTLQYSHIIHGDDIRFGSNYILCLNPSIHLNTWIHCSTLRACDNQWKEKTTGNQVTSLFANSSMNITANNQADHCIHSFSHANNPIPDVTTGNQVVNFSQCQRIHNELFSRASEVQRSYE